MRQAWQEFKEGWHEANWGSYFLLALFLPVTVLMLLDYLIEGKGSPPGLLFWLVIIPVIFVCLYWAGLRSGLDNWLGRFVFATTLLLFVILLIRHMVRTGERERTTTRRIGRYEVTVPVKRVSEEEAQLNRSIRRRDPQWWARAQAAFETLALAFQSARHATWST